MQRWAVVRGDLPGWPVAEVLRELAAQAASGRLHVAGDEGAEGLVQLRQGLVCEATLAGGRPQLPGRLLDAGAVAPEALEEALEAQRTALPAWRLGELLVHLGHAERAVVAAAEAEQLRDAAAELLSWTRGHWWFRQATRVRAGVTAPVPVETLLADVAGALDSPSAAVVDGLPTDPDLDALLALRRAIDLSESIGWPAAEELGFLEAGPPEAGPPLEPLGAEVAGRDPVAAAVEQADQAGLGQADQAERRAAGVALLSEMYAAGPGPGAEPVPEPAGDEPVGWDEAAHPDEWVDPATARGAEPTPPAPPQNQPAPPLGLDRTDTASLLRELSCLGGEEDGATAPGTPRATPRVVTPARPITTTPDRPRRRLGLFGR